MQKIPLINLIQISSEVNRTKSAKTSGLINCSDNDSSNKFETTIHKNNQVNLVNF